VVSTLSLLNHFSSFSDKISKLDISAVLLLHPHTHPPLQLNLPIMLLSELHLNLKYLRFFSTALTSTLTDLISHLLSEGMRFGPYSYYHQYRQSVSHLRSVPSYSQETYSRQRPTLQLLANLHPTSLSYPK